MRADKRGRPRLVAARRPGATAREEILDAAAELFTTIGYGATSTRRIADAVGIRQASLYHHFPTKDDILDTLLTGTVENPLQLAIQLRDEAVPAASALHTLAVADAAWLCGHTWNLGVLYVLPDLRSERFAAFHHRRDELRAHYRDFARLVIAGHDGPAAGEDLPFRLVESVINRRADDTGCPPGYPWAIADSALRVLGCHTNLARLREATARHLKSRPDIPVSPGDN